MEASKKPVEVKNTTKSTMWAVHAFYAWLGEHNEQCADNQCPAEILCMDDMSLLCHWLCIFVKELRRENGEPYTPRSISMLLCGLQRFINSKKLPSELMMKLIDSSHRSFKELHNVIEHCYRELHEQGIGATQKQADVTSREEEQALWLRGAPGTHSPLALLNSVFYYNGLHFILR